MFLKLMNSKDLFINIDFIKKIDRKQLMLLMFVSIITIISINIFRMTIFQLNEVEIFRFFTRYLGTAILCFFFSLILALTQKIRINSFVLAILFFLIFSSVYDFLSGDFTYEAFKINVVFNKLNQGIFISLFIYFGWSQLFDSDPDFVRLWLTILFLTMVLLNIGIIFLYFSGFLEINDHANLNNNRATLELFSVATTIYTISIKKNHPKQNYISLIFYCIVIILSTIYSSRLVFVGCILVLCSASFEYRHFSIKEQAALCGVLVLALMGLVDANANFSRELIRKYVDTVKMSSSYYDNNKKIVNLKNHSIGLEKLILELKQIEIIDDKIVVSKNTLSTISRLSNMMRSLKSSIKNPFGQGSVNANQRKSLGHSNHSVFFRNLEAYGVFFLVFVLILYFFLAPTKNLVVWTPLIIVGFFTSNLIWCTLLPFMAECNNSG